MGTVRSRSDQNTERHFNTPSGQFNLRLPLTALRSRRRNTRRGFFSLRAPKPTQGDFRFDRKPIARVKTLFRTLPRSVDRFCIKASAQAVVIQASLEFVSQGELHYAGLRQQSRVCAECIRRLQQRSHGRSDTLGIEASQVQHVEDLPAELQALTFEGPPALAQRHVETCVSIGPENVPRTASTRQRNAEVRLGAC